MSCAVGHRRGLDLVWLWPEPPYAASVALKRPKHLKKKKKNLKSYEDPCSPKHFSKIWESIVEGGMENLWKGT